MPSPQELGRLRPQLVRFALRRLRDRHRAEDAVQETLLAALEGLERFAGGSSLGTWLTGILRHKIADIMRASAREQPLEYAEAMLLDEDDPEAGLARQRAIQAVEAGLRQLSSCAARVFVLREVMGMGTAEVCRELGVSSSNCGVLHYRARRRLRARPEIRDAL